MKHSELYDRAKPLLRFAKGRDDRLTGVSVAWLLPSAILAELADPLQMAVSSATDDGSRKLENMLAEARCETLLQQLPSGGTDNRADERWHWARGTGCAAGVVPGYSSMNTTTSAQYGLGMGDSCALGGVGSGLSSEPSLTRGLANELWSSYPLSG